MELHLTQKQFRLRRLMPSENIIYFGDTARVPYGNRSRETLLQYQGPLIGPAGYRGPGGHHADFPGFCLCGCPFYGRFWPLCGNRRWTH